MSVVTSPAAPLKRIAVIGAGPKAAAIAVKAAAINVQRGTDLLQVQVFDKHGAGAAWTGEPNGLGYTDGQQRLCTLIERDLGFPYDRDLLPKFRLGHAAELVRKRFSWQAFVDEMGGRRALASWTDSGRRPPSHGEFAAYIDWALEQSGFSPLIDTVTAIEPAGAKRWRLHCQGRGEVADPFDGVVLTGTGPARRLGKLDEEGRPDTRGGAAPLNLFNGQDFWTRRAEVEAILAQLLACRRDGRNDIVIVGAGGTAAAILGWLIEHGAGPLPIKVVSSQAALHLRSENPFENRVFTDSDAWELLTPNARRTFSDRLTRGVVWDSVLERLGEAQALSFVEARADGYSVDADGAVLLRYKAFERFDEVPADSGHWVEHYKEGAALEAGLLVDATGFDPLAWTEMFTLLPSPLPTDFRANVEMRMGPYLELRGAPWSGQGLVHAPMLSTIVGPGFSNLMSLGAMADRVLAAYI